MNESNEYEDFCMTKFSAKLWWKLDEFLTEIFSLHVKSNLWTTTEGWIQYLEDKF